MIPLKKPAAKECSEHRTMSLIPHVSTVMLRILNRRTEAIAMIKDMAEKSVEHQRDMFVCFIYFEKAFDIVDGKKLMETLRNLDTYWKDRRLIRNLYHFQEVSVRISGQESGKATVWRDALQGCIMLSLLFSIYTEALMTEPPNRQH